MRSRRKVQNRMSVLKRTGKKNVLALALAIAMVSSTVAGEPLSIHAYADETNAISSSDDGSSKSDASSEKSTSVKEEKTTSKEEKTETKTEKSSEEKSGTSVAAKSAIQIVTEAENSASSDTKSSDVKLGTSDNDTKATEKDNASGQKSSGSTGNTSANSSYDKSTEATGTGASQSSESSKENTTETEITTTDAAKSGTASSDATTAANTSTGASTSTDVNGSASKGTGASTSTGSSTGAASTGAGAVPETTAPETNAPETSQAETTAAVETTEAETTAPETTAELDEEAEKKAESARIRRGILAADTAARKAKLGKTGSWKSSIFDFVKHLFYINVVADAENEADDVEDESISEMEVSEDDIDDYSVDLGKDYTANVVDDEDHVSGKNCFTSIIMARKVSGKWKAQSEFHDGDSVRVSLAVSIPSDAMDEDSRVFYYQLPSAVTISEAQSGLMKRDDIVIGKYVLTEDGMLVVKLTDNISVNQKFRGIIVFDAQLSKDSDQTMEKIDFGSFVFILHDGVSNDAKGGDAEDIDADVMDETEPTDTVQDDANKVATESEIDADGELNTRAGVLRVSNRIVTASANFPAETFPIGTKMQVVRVKKPSELKTLKTKVDEQLENENSGKIAKDIYAYDISFIYDGEKIEPLNPVDISLSFNKSQGKPKATKAEDPKKAEWKMFHATEDGEIAEKTDAAENASEEAEEDENAESVESSNENNASATDNSTTEETTSYASENTETTTENNTTDLITENSVLHDITEDAEVSTDKDNTVVHKVDFSSDEFSVYVLAYTVDFHLGDFTFNLEGNSEILLSELFDELEISEKASDVIEAVFSDPSLLEITKITDENEITKDWNLKSLKPFDTNELLTLTFSDGEKMTIEVTDDQKKLEGVDIQSKLTKETKFYKIENGKEIEATEFNDGDSVSIHVEYYLEPNAVPDKKAYFKLPDGIVTSDHVHGNVVEGGAGGSSTVLGTYEIITVTDEQGKTGKYVQFKYNDNYDPAKEHYGTFDFKSTLQSSSDGTEDRTISLGGFSGQVTIHHKYDMSVVKTGTKQDGNKISYSIQVSSQHGTGGNSITVTDAFSAPGYDGATVKANYDSGSVKVVDSNGNIVSNCSAVVGTDGKLVISGLQPLKANESYTITYDATVDDNTKISSDGSKKVVNRVKSHVDYSEGDTHHAPDAYNGTTVEYTHHINKKGEYDYKTEKIKWTVYLNDNHDKIKNYSSFTDYLPNGLTVIGNVKITDAQHGEQFVEFSADGQSTVQFDPSTMNTLTPVNGTSNTINIDDETSDSYIIEFYTNAPSTNGKISNTASTVEEGKSYSASGEADVAHREEKTTKRVGNPTTYQDEGTTFIKRIPWSVAHNFQDGEISEFTIEDTIGDVIDGSKKKVDAEHYAIASEVDELIRKNIYACVIVDKNFENWDNIKFKEKFDITINYFDANGNNVSASDKSTHVKRFVIKCKAKDNKSYNIFSVDTADYYTYVDLSKLPNSNSGYQVFNTALEAEANTWVSKNKTGDFEKKVKQNGNYTTEDISFTHDQVQAANGLLQYLISFKVGKDQNGDIDIHDTLPSGMKYIEGSAKFGFYDGSNNLYDYYNNDSTNYPFTFNDKKDATVKVEGQKLTFHFPGGYNPKNIDGVRIAVKYNTSIADDADFKDVTKSGKIYTNTAEYNGKTISESVTITRDEAKSYKSGVQLYADGTPVELDENGNPIEKEGNPLTNIIKYSVVINPNKETLFEGKKITLTDEISWVTSGVTTRLYQESVKLYYYDPVRPYNAGAEVDPSEYTFKYDESSKKMTLEIPDSTALTLVYKYQINLGDNAGDVEIKNCVRLNGKYAREIVTKNRVEESSATINQKEIDLYKVDADNYNKYLKGAKFKLEKYENNNWTTVSKNLETDENGKITIGSTSSQVNGFAVKIDSRKLYRLIEQVAPDGYALDQTPQYLIWGLNNDAKDTLIASMKKDGTYDSSVDANNVKFFTSEGGTFNITNKSIRLTVRKRWVDQDGKEIAPGSDSVKVSLYKTSKVLDPVTIKIRFHGRYYTIVDWSNNTKAYDGSTFNFEDEIEVKKNSNAALYVNGWSIENEKISVSGIDEHNVYFDNNHSNIHIDSVTKDCIIDVEADKRSGNNDAPSWSSRSVPAYVDAENLIETRTLDEGNKWTTYWDELPISDEHGDITYRVVETENPNGYSIVYQTNGGVLKKAENAGNYSGDYIIKNVSDKKRIQFDFTKLWLDRDGNECAWPENIDALHFTLKAKGNPNVSIPFTVTRDGNITADEGYSFPAKPLYTSDDNAYRITINGLKETDDNGNAYEYTLSEEDVDGYKAEYYTSDDAKLSDKKITNGGIIKNKPKSEYVLPATGARGSTWIYLLGSIILLLGAEWYLLTHKEVNRK